MSKYYQPAKLLIGASMLDVLPEVLSGYGKRVLLVSTNDEPLQPLYDKIHGLLDGFDVVHFTGVVPNPTVESVDACLPLAVDIDVIVAVGGGSSMDTAKAINLKLHHPHDSWESLFERYDSFAAEYDTKFLPLVSIPTTSGTGSQVTQAAVLSMGVDKLTLYHTGLLSDVAILDPNLTTTLPRRLTSATAFDTFTHAFESYLSDKSNALTRLDSLNAMQIVVNTLPKVLEDPQNVTLREQLMVADTLGGRSLSNAGAHAPHPLSEIIGGLANAMHGEALASVYPAFIKIGNARFEETFKSLSQTLFDQDDLYTAMVSFLEMIQLNISIKDLVKDEATFEAIRNHPVWGVLPFGDRDFFEAILDEAY